MRGRREGVTGQTKARCPCRFSPASSGLPCARGPRAVSSCESPQRAGCPPPHGRHLLLVDRGPSFNGIYICEYIRSIFNGLGVEEACLHSPSSLPRPGVSLSPRSPVGELPQPLPPSGRAGQRLEPGQRPLAPQAAAPPPPARWQLWPLGPPRRVLRELWQLAWGRPLAPRSCCVQAELSGSRGSEMV